MLFWKKIVASFLAALSILQAAPQHAHVATRVETAQKPPAAISAPPRPISKPHPAPRPTHRAASRSHVRAVLTPKQYARSLVAPDEWSCLDAMWTEESNWDPTNQNPTSTAYGIAQFLDGTWEDLGVVKTSNPYKQIDYGLRYIRERYGTVCAAWDFHLRNGYY